MNYTHFIFAFYVFLLVCGAIWFYGRVMRSDKKKDRSSYEKEHRLFVMYQNVEDMLDSFEEYAEEAKSGIDARLGQVESFMENMRREWERLRETASADAPGGKPAPDTRQETADPQPAPAARQEDTVQPAPEPGRQAPASAPEADDRAETETPQPSGKSPADKPKQKTPDLIQQYAEQGMSKEAIAKALGISKREVSLIMEIKKIHV